MKSFIFVCLILCLSNVAYAGLFDSVVSQVQQVAQTAQQQAAKQRSPSGVANNTPTVASQNGNDENSVPIIDIKEGAYKIPFGVGTDEILKWGDQETDSKELQSAKIGLFSYTNEGLETDIRTSFEKAVGGQSEATYNQDVANGQQELQKAPFSEIRDLFKKVKNGEKTQYYFVSLDIDGIQNDFNLLDNPPPPPKRFTYKNYEFILSDVFNCQNVNDKSIKGICKDEDWEGKNYQFNFIQNGADFIMNDGVKSIVIKFYKDDDQQLKSYATIVQFDADVSGIINSLNEKYGKFSILASPDVEIMTALGPVDEPAKNLLSPGGVCLMWRKNIFMIYSGQINTRPEPGIPELDTPEGPSYLLHYDPVLGGKVIDYYNETIKMIVDESQKEKNLQAAKAKGRSAKISGTFLK